MKRIDHIADLALIRALPEFMAGKLKEGRLKNKSNLLIKAVDQDLKRLGPISDFELEMVRLKMIEFGKRTGWQKKEKHLATLLSFLLAMVEDSSFYFNPKILENLNHMFDYFDNAGDAKIICNVAGAIANTKWQSIKMERIL